MLSFGVSPGRVWCLGCVSFPQIIMVNPLSRVFRFARGSGRINKRSLTKSGSRQLEKGVDAENLKWVGKGIFRKMTEHLKLVLNFK